MQSPTDGHWNNSQMRWLGSSFVQTCQISDTRGQWATDDAGLTDPHGSLWSALCLCRLLSRLPPEYHRCNASGKGARDNGECDPKDHLRKHRYLEKLRPEAGKFNTRRAEAIMRVPVAFDREVHDYQHRNPGGIGVRDQHLCQHRPSQERKGRAHQEQDEPNNLLAGKADMCRVRRRNQKGAAHKQHESNQRIAHGSPRASWAFTCGLELDGEIDSEYEGKPADADDGSAATGRPVE